MPLKRTYSRYVEDEACHSGDETSEGGSVAGDESEENDSMVCSDNEVEYEEGADSSDDFHHASLQEKELKKHARKLETERKRRKLEQEAKEMGASMTDAARQLRERQASAAPPAPPTAKPDLKWTTKTPNAKSSSSSSETFASPDLSVDSEEENDMAAPKPASPPPSKPKLASNKVLHESAIPPKPVATTNKKSSTSHSKKFMFRMFFTNGAMFHKFLLPIANAVHELRFNLTSTPAFTGIRLEAHDTYITLANKSRFECDIDAGVDEHGVPVTPEELTGMSFCVSASSFMQTLSCATLKDTVLTITKYVDSPDKITFEAITNENDVQTVYTCDILAESRLESLKGMQFNLGYHVNLYLKTLKEQTSNAKRCGATTLYFELFQAQDEEDDAVVHSRLSVGFKGSVTSGSHDFYQSARKVEREGTDGAVITEWEPLAGLSAAQRSSLKMERRSYNVYDNSKLRLFLNHMDVEWVLVHLCDDETQKPLVMECMVGGKNTKHTIIVAPKVDDAKAADE